MNERGKKCQSNCLYACSSFRLLNEVAEKNKRSKLIVDAVKAYIRDIKKKALRDRLEKGYKARAKRDKNIAKDWFEGNVSLIHT